MDAVNDPAVREIWVQKSAQIGWTEILNNVIGYFVDQDPSPIMVVQPTQDAAEDWSRDRLTPMIRDTPCLAEKFSQEKARAASNTLRHKNFKGGLLAVAISNSPSSLASKPIRILLLDEVDKYPGSAGKSGDPVRLAAKRTTTFWNRKVLAGSTPTIKGQSKVEAGFLSSDQRFYFVPCPHCDEFQRLVWSQVRWTDDDTSTAVYVCAHCAACWNDAEKADALLRGQWRATKPFKGVAGFHIWEGMASFVRMEEIARNFLEAKKLPETLQQFINESLGETWEDSGESVKPEGLLARRESYTDATLPSGVLLLTRGTDVQDDRLESTLWGWGRDGEAWRIRHDVMRGDPASNELWREHDDLLRRTFRTEDGRTIVCEAVAVDSGGHHTETVYTYCAARKRYRVYAIKGVTGPKPAWPKKASRGGARRQDVWPIGVDTIKDVVGGRLRKIEAAGPGYIHLDATVDEVCVEQLASEVQAYVVVKGRKVRVWRPRRAGIRNEQFDCLVYAYAAMVGRGGQGLVDRREPISAEPETVTAEQTAPERPEAERVPEFNAPKRRSAPARRSWVKSWRQ